MRRRAFVSLFLAAFVGSIFETDLGAAQAQDAREFVAISGVPTMIYGGRSECAKDVAPSYEAVLESNAVTRPPEHGALSRGGVEERYSKRCDRRVPAGLVFCPPAEHREAMSGLAIPFSMWQCAGHGDAAGPGFVR